MQHVLENEALKLLIDDTGAELCSVLDRESGSERIWTADPAIWNRHAPILFPFVGKVTDGKYRIEGREYPMRTQHGFARDMDFLCVEEDASSVTHRLASTPGLREIYPYSFCLTVRHSLDPANPRLLHITWDVENQGEDLMYYAIGGHPGFLMPDGVRKEDCRLVFPAGITLLITAQTRQASLCRLNRKSFLLQTGWLHIRQTFLPPGFLKDRRLRV